MNSGEIGTGTKFMMVLIAICIDVLQVSLALFPLIGIFLEFIVGPMISIAALVVYFLWFKANGVNIYKGRNWGATFTNMLIEILPGFDIFTGWTFWVIYTIWFGKRSESGV